jgi:hypothetical protein
LTLKKRKVYMVGFPGTKGRDGLTVRLAVLAEERVPQRAEVIQLVAQLNQCATHPLEKRQVQNA